MSISTSSISYTLSQHAVFNHVTQILILKTTNSVRARDNLSFFYYDANFTHGLDSYYFSIFFDVTHARTNARVTSHTHARTNGRVWEAVDLMRS